MLKRLIGYPSFEFLVNKLTAIGLKRKIDQGPPLGRYCEFFQFWEINIFEGNEIGKYGFRTFDCLFISMDSTDYRR